MIILSHISLTEQAQPETSSHNSNDNGYKRQQKFANQRPKDLQGPFREMLDARKLKVLGHVDRKDKGHQHHVTFSTASAMPRKATRRVGLEPTARTSAFAGLEEIDRRCFISFRD